MSNVRRGLRAPITSESQARPPARSAESKTRNPLGLNIIHEPKNGHPQIDIIFVHGLGGKSEDTWSYRKSPKLFWPKIWLPHEPGMGQARMSSFGYNAAVGPTWPRIFFHINDFALDLLFRVNMCASELSLDVSFGEVCCQQTCPFLLDCSVLLFTGLG